MKIPLRILILSSYDCGDITTGLGLILTHTLRSLREIDNIELSYGQFSPLNYIKELTPPSEEIISDISIVFKIERPQQTKLDTLRGLLRLPCNDLEKTFLNEVSHISEKYDCAIWFGSSLDAVTRELPNYCICPILYHLTDSLTLFYERQRNKLFKRLRLLLAKIHERFLLSTGYARIIYVGKEDYNYGLKLSSTSGVEKICFLPIGVDEKEFYPDLKENKRTILLFAGVMCYQPNIDAAMYLIQEILPKIKNDVELRIAGRDPAHAILKASRHDQRIVVTGTIDNMVDEYHLADIFLAPMISGSGIQNKILQALACGLPVVTTPICAAAFDAIPDAILVGNNTTEIVKIAVKLIEFRELRKELGSSGRVFIEEHLTWKKRAEKMYQIFSEVIC
jgi:glycosyltransferase involved in cell wall biosynthesis